MQKGCRASSAPWCLITQADRLEQYDLAMARYKKHAPGIVPSLNPLAGVCMIQFRRSDDRPTCAGSPLAIGPSARSRTTPTQEQLLWHDRHFPRIVEADFRCYSIDELLNGKNASVSARLAGHGQVTNLFAPRRRRSTSAASLRVGASMSHRKKLFPAEQARLVQLLIERVNIGMDRLVCFTLYGGRDADFPELTSITLPLQFFH